MHTTDLGMPFLLENGSVEAAAALCAELKLDFVELNMTFPCCAAECLCADMLRTLSQKYGIYFTFHLHEALSPCTFSTPVRNAWLESTKAALSLARAAQVSAVNMHWERGIYVTLPEHVEYLYARYEEEYIRHTLAFRELCLQEAAGQVLVCIENTNGFLPFQRQAIELLLQSPCFALTLDVGHDYVARYVDQPLYIQHASRLRHMHLHDAAGSHCHLPLGSGKRDVPTLMHLAQTRHARVVLEIKTVAALRDSLQYLSDKNLL